MELYLSILYGQGDIEHVPKICFLSLEGAETCAEHHMVHVKEEDKCNRKGKERQED